MKPKYQLKIRFAANEIANRPNQDQGPAWTALAEPLVATFDSANGGFTERPEYFEGHDPGVKAHCWYGYLQGPEWHDPRASLRVIWWEVEYPDGSEWIAGAVLNESIELPVGRTRGDLRVWIEGTEHAFGYGLTTLSDENGCTFSFGQPKANISYEKLAFFLNQSPKEVQLPKERWWQPLACPDAQGAGTWQDPWVPKDRTGDPRYAGDSRNPGIDKILNGIKVPRWYERQTHSHYRETFRSPYETGFIAAKKAKNKELELAICRAVWEWSASQTGCVSPQGGGNYCDGRPNHLGFLDGTLPRAGQRYRLSQVDTGALRPFVLHEGRPEIGKGGGYQFTECFNRQTVHWLELRSSQYAGQYGLPNGSDFEHGGQENLVAAALILGDPLAKRQLHHICEEHVSQIEDRFPEHSTRSTAGWLIKDLWLGYLVFQGNSEFGEDAERYRAAANKVAQRVWQHRIDTTPYQCVLGVSWEKYDKSQPEETWLIYEATMQLGIALHAACYGVLLETEPTMKKLWRDLVSYIGGCLLQPGVIDWDRGGIIARYSSRGPAPDDGTGKTIGERLQISAPPQYNFRNVLGAEGWIGPALALAARVTGFPSFELAAREIYDRQKLKSESRGVLMMSPAAWGSWGMHHESVVTFGWNQISMAAPEGEAEPSAEEVAAFPATAPNYAKSW